MKTNSNQFSEIYLFERFIHCQPLLYVCGRVYLAPGSSSKTDDWDGPPPQPAFSSDDDDDDDGGGGDVDVDNDILLILVPLIFFFDNDDDGDGWYGPPPQTAFPTSDCPVKIDSRQSTHLDKWSGGQNDNFDICDVMHLSADAHLQINAPLGVLWVIAQLCMKKSKSVNLQICNCKNMQVYNYV